MPAIELPADAPQTLGEAFAQIGKVTAPTVLDMKVMVLTEAAAMALYYRTAELTDDPRVKDLLQKNGREEMLHAHRAMLAIKVVSGEDFYAPMPEDNPYLAGGTFPLGEMTKAGLEKLAQGEFGGEKLYEVWAANTPNQEAARLFRLNGGEERDHGNRLLEAAALLGG